MTDAIHAPTPSRITAALDIRQMYGPGVDEACGVREPAVDQWEAGTLIPTREQIHKLAVLTGYPESFFYLPPLPEFTDGFICIRRGRDRGCHRISSALRSEKLPPATEPLW